MKKYFIIILLLICMFHVKHVSALDFSNIKYLATSQQQIGESSTGVIDTKNQTDSSRLFASKVYSTNFSNLANFKSDVIVFGGQFLVSNVNRTYQLGQGQILGQDNTNVNYNLYIYQDSDTPTISTDISQLITWNINTNKGDFRCDFDNNGIVLCPYKLLGDDTIINSVTVTFLFPNYVDHQGLNSYNIFYYYTNIGGRVWFINYYNYDLENVETKLQNIYDLLNGKCETSSSYFNFDLNQNVVNTSGGFNFSSSFKSTSNYYTGLSSFSISSGTPNSSGQYAFIQVFDNNKNFIRRDVINSGNVSSSISLDSSYYYRFSIVSDGVYSLSYCSSGIKDAISGINQGTQDINNSINDSNVSGGGSISDMSSSVADDSGIEDIFLLPVRLIQNVLNALNSNSCSPINLGSLYGSNLQMTCIDVRSIVGNQLYNVIDLFFAFGIVLGVRKYVLEIFEKISSLKEDKLSD